MRSSFLPRICDSSLSVFRIGSFFTSQSPPLPIKSNSLLEYSIRQSSLRFRHEQEFLSNTFLVVSCQIKIDSFNISSWLCYPCLSCCYSILKVCGIDIFISPATICQKVQINLIKNNISISDVHTSKNSSYHKKQKQGKV